MGHRLQRRQLVGAVAPDRVASEGRLASELLAVDAVHQDAWYFDGGLTIIDVGCPSNLLVLAALMHGLVLLTDVASRHPVLRVERAPHHA